MADPNISKKPDIELVCGQLSAIIESSDDAIIGKNLDGVITSWNEGAEHIYGYTAAEIVGKPVYTVIPDNRRDEMVRIMRDIKSGKRVKHFETERVTKSGKKIIVSLTVSPILSTSHKIIGASTIARDVTEQKLNEEKMRMSNEEWDKTFNSISDLIFIQDMENTIIRGNKAFIDAMKLKPEELIGKKCFQVLHKLNKPWPECPMEKSKLDKKSHTEEVDDPNIGTALLITTSPIFDKDGKMIGSVHIARDIGARKKMEEDLRRKIEALERFQRITVGRELKMKELKARIAELEAKCKEL